VKQYLVRAGAKSLGLQDSGLMKIVVIPIDLLQSETVDILSILSDVGYDTSWEFITQYDFFNEQMHYFEHTTSTDKDFEENWDKFVESEIHYCVNEINTPDVLIPNCAKKNLIKNNSHVFRCAYIGLIWEIDRESFDGEIGELIVEK